MNTDNIINDTLLNEGVNLESPTEDENKSNKDVLNEKSNFIFEALSIDDVNEIEFEDKPELITLLGLTDFGKSTFTGSLYHLLRTNNEFEGFSLIDSCTLTGFERRVYLRILNDERMSVVKRTFVNQNSILHLKLREKSTGIIKNVLLSDAAGELYQQCISKDDTVKQQLAVKYADKLLVFFNCEDFKDPVKNWSRRLTSILKRFSSNDMLPENAQVYIVLNKYDTICENNKINITSYIGEIIDIIQTYFNISEDDVYKINSKGLNVAGMDQNLVSLIREILTTRNNKPYKYNCLDWIKIEIDNCKK